MICSCGAHVPRLKRKSTPNAQQPDEVTAMSAQPSAHRQFTTAHPHNEEPQKHNIIAWRHRFVSHCRRLHNKTDAPGKCHGEHGNTGSLHYTKIYTRQARPSGSAGPWHRCSPPLHIIQQVGTGTAAPAHHSIRRRTIIRLIIAESAPGSKYAGWGSAVGNAEHSSSELPTGNATK